MCIVGIEGGVYGGGSFVAADFVPGAGELAAAVAVFVDGNCDHVAHVEFALVFVAVAFVAAGFVVVALVAVAYAAVVFVAVAYVVAD